MNHEVELKGGMYTFMSLRLFTDDLATIDRQLAEKVQQAPGFFKDTPVVVDLAALDEHDDCMLDAASLLELIRSHHLQPIVASVGDKSSRLGQTVALPLIESRSKRQNGDKRGASTPTAAGDDAPSLHQRPASVPDEPESTQASEVEYVIKAPTLIDKPVRSGQQIYARDTDLIVMGQVGPGAEVVADNNIHVYGPLRGRALCGVSGNTRTRIFCQSLEAELVSVAGNFRLLEQVPEALRGKPAQIWLDRDKLNIEPL